MQLPAGIKDIALGEHGLRGLQIETPLCRALISRQGAQLLQFQAQGQPPLLWLSEAALFQPGRSIRGGIPLCFPWFGAAPAPGLPAHGFARHRLWQLEKATADGDDRVLSFSLHDDADTRTLWPHAFTARQILRLGTHLTLTLEVENRDREPWQFSFAQHSYFPTPDIRQTRVMGLEGRPYFDALQDWKVLSSEAAGICFGAETDRVYEGASGCYRIVDDSGRQPDILIHGPDCRSAIVWNPWPEKSRRLGDMGENGWTGMLCVESGNTGRDSIRLAPGECRSFTLTLTHERLA